MGYKTKILRNQIIFILLAIGILMSCSWLIGFANMLKILLFFLLAVVGLIGGTFFVILRFGHKERLSFIILASWYGFIFALLTFFAMVFDPKSASYTWVYSLQLAGIVGVGTFLFIILTTPLNMAALRFWRKSFGNPVIHRK